MKTGTGSALYLFQRGRTPRKANSGQPFFGEIIVARGPETGVSRHVRTKLYDQVVRLVKAGGYFQAA